MKKNIRVFVVSRRRKHILSLCLICFGFFLLFMGFDCALKTVETISSPMSNTVVLIDPGHGGIDKGASEGDAIEKELNLQISMLLKSYIEENGGICYMTRAEDTNTADPNRPKGVSQKQSDLKTRKKNIDDFNADIFVSIHMNKFAQSKYSGLQVFYDKNYPESKALAEAIQQTAKDIVDKNNTRTAKATGENIYVLKGNEIPSVLVECGFLSNVQEREALKNPQYQRKVAWGIYLGIMNYLNR